MKLVVFWREGDVRSMICVLKSVGWFFDLKTSKTSHLFCKIISYKSYKKVTTIANMHNVLTKLDERLSALLIIFFFNSCSFLGVEG